MDMIISFLVILAASAVGAIAGIGGGVIIKPVLDVLSLYDIYNINFISSWSVFSMSVVSIITHLRKGTRIEKKLAVTLAVGSLAGGILGGRLFDILAAAINNGALTKAVQAVVLSLLLVAVIIYLNTSLRRYAMVVKNTAAIAGLGLLLGLCGAFLGIGGGPINVTFLVVFFSMGVKECAVYSIITILFGQSSKLITMAVTGGFSGMNFTLLLAAIPAAILGGFLGSNINKKCSEKFVSTVFTGSMLVIILLNVINIVRAF